MQVHAILLALAILILSTVGAYFYIARESVAPRGLDNRSDVLRTEETNLRIEVEDLRHRVSDLEAELNDLRDLIALEKSRTPVDGDSASSSTLRDSMDEALGELKRLEVGDRLKLTASWLQKKVPRDFHSISTGEVQFLRTLNLKRKSLSDDEMVHLSDLGYVNSLTLADNAITDVGLAHLESLGSLTHLDLGETNVEGYGLASLRSIPLEWIRLDGSQIHDGTIDQLRNLTTLTKVKLNRTSITDAGLAILGACTWLKEIEIDSTSITSQGLRHLLAANPSLQRIEARFTAMDGEVISELRRLYPNCEIVIQ